MFEGLTRRQWMLMFETTRAARRAATGNTLDKDFLKDMHCDSWGYLNCQPDELNSDALRWLKDTYYYTLQKLSKYLPINYTLNDCFAEGTTQVNIFFEKKKKAEITKRRIGKLRMEL